MMKRLLQRVVALRKEQRGGGELFFFLFIIVSLMLAGLGGNDIIRYSILKTNITTAATETLQYVKVQGGADGNTRSMFDKLLREMQINPSNITFTATQYPVQRGNPIKITATRPYQSILLETMGITYEKPIVVETAGLAWKHIR